MKAFIFLIAIALLSQGAAATYWQQFFSENCAGTVENDGTITCRKALAFTTTFTARGFNSEVTEAIYRYASASQTSTSTRDLGRKQRLPHPAAPHFQLSASIAAAAFKFRRSPPFHVHMRWTTCRKTRALQCTLNADTC